MIVGRFGTILGIVISDLGLFKIASGPAIAGVLSVTAAILSRLLPGQTLLKFYIFVILKPSYIFVLCYPKAVPCVALFLKQRF